MHFFRKTREQNRTFVVFTDEGGFLSQYLKYKEMEKRNIKDFLNDDKFILWRLTGDGELESYWKGFLVENPASKVEFESAIKVFSALRLKKTVLNDTEYERLLRRIKATLSRMQRQRRVHLLVRYAAAACIALIAGFAAWHYYINGARKANEVQADISGIIVGENLEDKDIVLITGEASISFDKDVTVQLDESGKAIVREASSTKATVFETAKTQMNTLVVPYGKRSRIELSDGTLIWLNSGSVLEFPAAFSANTRQVKLIGEMYIEVARDDDKPFTVSTSGFDVQVLGTKFNISAYHDAETQSVVLIEGKVSVKSASRGETALNPSDMLVARDDRWDTQRVDVDEYTSWKNGYLVLNRTPIAELLHRLERYYNLSFNVQENVKFGSKTVSGKIVLSENIDEVMKTLALLTSTKYTREGKTIYIR
jgi:ferric-dicitrate binding protein FerR (iron transport regulator)